MQPVPDTTGANQREPARGTRRNKRHGDPARQPNVAMTQPPRSVSMPQEEPAS